MFKIIDEIIKCVQKNGRSNSSIAFLNRIAGRQGAQDPAKYASRDFYDGLASP